MKTVTECVREERLLRGCLSQNWRTHRVNLASRFLHIHPWLLCLVLATKPSKIQEGTLPASIVEQRRTTRSLQVLTCSGPLGKAQLLPPSPWSHVGSIMHGCMTVMLMDPAHLGWSSRCPLPNLREDILKKCKRGSLPCNSVTGSWNWGLGWWMSTIPSWAPGPFHEAGYLGLNWLGLDSVFGPTWLKPNSAGRIRRTDCLLGYKMRGHLTRWGVMWPMFGLWERYIHNWLQYDSCVIIYHRGTSFGVLQLQESHIRLSE